jgi:hypothetical protein
MRKLFSQLSPGDKLGLLLIGATMIYGATLVGTVSLVKYKTAKLDWRSAIDLAELSKKVYGK